MMDSTVAVRYGQKQPGAERGYNPKKQGRPCHHPLLAFIREMGDCLGVRWRARSAHSAEGAQEWLETLVERLRGAGVGDITVRLDKGFLCRDMVRTLERLGVSRLLKVPRHGWLDSHRGPWRFSAKEESVFPSEDVRTATGTLWGVRLLTVQTTRPMKGDAMLDLGADEVQRQADMLTNIGGIHALTAWRLYNKGRRGRAADRGTGPAVGRQDGGRRHRRQRPVVEPRRRGLPGAAHASRTLPLRLLRWVWTAHRIRSRISLRAYAASDQHVATTPESLTNLTIVSPISQHEGPELAP